MTHNTIHCIYCSTPCLRHGPAISCPHCGQDFALLPTATAQSNPSGIDTREYAISRKYSSPPLTEPDARRSLRCALLLFWLTPIPCLLAIFFGYRSLMRFPPNAPYPSRLRAIAGVILGFIGLFILWPLILCGVHRLNQGANNLDCAAHTRELGAMVYVYQRAHHRSPNTIPEMMLPEYEISAVCPTDGDLYKAARSGNLSAFPSDRRTSYVYIGQGHEINTHSSDPVFFEPYSRHPQYRTTMVFREGHGESVPPADAVTRLQAAEDAREWVSRAGGASSQPTEVRQ